MDARADLHEGLDGLYFGESQDEIAEVDAFVQLLADARVVVDVGASLGQYALAADRALTGATIYAIEGDPVRFEWLRKNCATASGNTLMPIHAAIADGEAGTVSFFRTEKLRSGGLFAFPGDRDFEWETVRVPAATLDDLFASAVPDLVKIDIEGTELRAVRGAKAIIGQRRTRFLIEVHPWGDPEQGARPSDVFMFFARSGYRFQRVGRLWLFTPADTTRAHIARARLIGAMMDRPWIRSLARRIIHLASSSPSRGRTRTRP